MNSRSNTRIECDKAVLEFSKVINQKSGRLLYVGIAGDPPGGEYSPLFQSYNITTFDKDPKWNPDLVGDICYPEFPPNYWDAIICVQVLEHLPKIFRLPKALWVITKLGGYVIIDCPWNYPYHAEPPSFKDYWRISKDGLEELFNPWFKIVQIKAGENNTSCLLEKS